MYAALCRSSARAVRGGRCFCFDDVTRPGALQATRLNALRHGVHDSDAGLRTAVGDSRQPTQRVRVCGRCVLPPPGAPAGCRPGGSGAAHASSSRLVALAARRGRRSGGPLPRYVNTPGQSLPETAVPDTRCARSAAGEARRGRACRSRQPGGPRQVRRAGAGEVVYPQSSSRLCMDRGSRLPGASPFTSTPAEEPSRCGCAPDTPRRSPQR